MSSHRLGAIEKKDSRKRMKKKCEDVSNISYIKTTQVEREKTVHVRKTKEHDRKCHVISGHRVQQVTGMLIQFLYHIGEGRHASNGNMHAAPRPPGSECAERLKLDQDEGEKRKKRKKKTPL